MVIKNLSLHHQLERQALIDEYQNENGPFIFMLSTKAGMERLSREDQY